jgi:uncharacterized membrane protein YkoI
VNTAKLRSKRAILAAVASAAVLSVGGVVWTSTANAEVGSERDRVVDAAVKAVPGTVLDVETSDDQGEAYEVEVRRTDGTEVDVVLDKNLAVIAQDAGDADGDDRAVDAAQRASAEKAALAAVAGGTITEVEAGDDEGVAYEVGVRAADNTEWDVELDAGFTVLRKTVDN